MPGALKARAAEVHEAERFLVVPEAQWSYPAPIARQRLDTLGAVLYAVRHSDGSNHALYGLYRRETATAAWVELVLNGSAWLEDGFRQPTLQAEQPLVECVAVATHGGNGRELIRLIPGRVAERVTDLEILDDGREAPCEISSLGTFIALSVSRPASSPPPLRALSGDRETTLQLPEVAA